MTTPKNHSNNSTQDLFAGTSADTATSAELTSDDLSSSPNTSNTLTSIDLPADKMTPVEMRATVSLAAIYGLRMFGMFSILPIFAIYASNNFLPQPNSLQIGLALGAYGLTQALFQLPFGMASDKFGRKPMIYLGLAIFAIGSMVAALAMNIEGVILGRAIQGAGAVSAAVTALLADLTRDENRTKGKSVV